MTTAQKRQPPKKPQAVVRHEPDTRAVSPMEMLGIALQKADFNPATLEKLMDLAERWERDQAKRAYVRAKAAAKSEIGVIQKNKRVKYKGKDGKPDTDYAYAGLDDMYREVVPVLAKHGLSHSYRSRQNGNELVLTCVLSHADGHSEDACEIGAKEDIGSGKNAIQAVISTATYLQRVTLALALGLAAGKDDDAKNAGIQVFITAAQVARIDTLMEATQTRNDDPRWLDYLKEKFAVEGVNDLSEAQAETLIKMLKRKLQQQGR
jgi:hypothetical protein